MYEKKINQLYLVLGNETNTSIPSSLHVFQIQRII